MLFTLKVTSTVPENVALRQGGLKFNHLPMKLSCLGVVTIPQT